MARPRKLDIEVHKGRIVAVWFGCVALPFEVIEVDEERNRDLLKGEEGPTCQPDGYHSIEYFDNKITKTLKIGIPGEMIIERFNGE